MMTIEQQALALVNEVLIERRFVPVKTFHRGGSCDAEAICRALERHEAFRQEVSEAVKAYLDNKSHATALSRFIIAPPVDPVLLALRELAGLTATEDDAEVLRAALAKHSLAIRKEA